MDPRIFVSVCDLVFFFLLESNRLLQTDTRAVFLCGVQYCQKKKNVFVTTRVKYWGSFRGFFFTSFNGILVAQKLFRKKLLTARGFEMDRS